MHSDLGNETDSKTHEKKRCRCSLGKTSMPMANAMDMMHLEEQ